MQDDQVFRLRLVRRRPSKITRFPAAIRERVDAMLDAGETYDDVLRWITAEGYTVGRSSVGRYAQARAQRAARVKLLAAASLRGVNVAGASKRRAHTNIDRLPPDVRDDLAARLVAGVTYDDLVAWAKSRGHHVSRSGVARWASAVRAHDDWVRSLLAEADLRATPRVP